MRSASPPTTQRDGRSVKWLRKLLNGFQPFLLPPPVALGYLARVMLQHDLTRIERVVVSDAFFNRLQHEMLHWNRPVLLGERGGRATLVYGGWEIECDERIKGNPVRVYERVNE